MQVRDRELWQEGAPRRFTDAVVARLFGITPGYVTKMRGKHWLPSRPKIKTGEVGGKGRLRYSFLEVVAAEVARISATEFRWSQEDLQRVVSLIRSGDAKAVSAAKVVTFEGESAHRVRVMFFAPEEREQLNAARKQFKVRQETSLREVVETVASSLFKKMVAAGFEFSGVVGGPKPKRQKRKRN